jgi:hypothetical protein
MIALVVGGVFQAGAAWWIGSDPCFCSGVLGGLVIAVGVVAQGLTFQSWRVAVAEDPETQRKKERKIEAQKVKGSLSVKAQAEEGALSKAQDGELSDS